MSIRNYYDRYWGKTENDALALKTTGNPLLDLFASIGSIRSMDASDTRTALPPDTQRRAKLLFDEAYSADPLMATKILFYARDIREGLGERAIFRFLINYIANNNPEALEKNLDLIGVFGRYDDLYSLINTPLEEKMWVVMKNQLEEDLANMEAGNTVSLLAKWVATADSANISTRRLGCLTARKLGYTVYDFKRKYRALRKYIGVIEGLMATGQWDKITYSKVPSRAMLIYRRVFAKHDKERFEAFLDDVSKGKEKIHASTLYPYDIVEKILYSHENSRVLEEQWKALPDYTSNGMNALVVADVSGSMEGRPLATSIGLALYFAERNKGDFHNMFMTFSSAPQLITVKGNTLEAKVKNIEKSNVDMSTNLKAAFKLILHLAVKNHVKQEELPKALIIVSDMEIDRCTDKKWTFYDYMKQKYEEAGYKLPNITFWNVNSRNNIFHVDADRLGVQCFSGSSVSTFKFILNTIGMTPVEVMEYVINSERYSCISI